MSDAGNKPQAGTIAPVEVQPWYKHASIIVTSALAAIPFVIMVLVQLQELPGLPTNVLGFITTTVSVLTAIYVAYQKFQGKPMVTPTAAAKLIQTTPEIK